MLNKKDGETLPIIGKGVVAPVEKWANVLDMLTIASEAAAAEFHKLGLSLPVEFREDDILVQEYHRLDMLMFIFCKRVKGQDHYYWYKFEFGLPMVRELTAAGLWPGGLPRPPLIIQ